MIKEEKYPNMNIKPFVKVYFLIFTIVICVNKMNRDGDTRFPWWVSDLRRNQEKFQDLEIIL